MRHDAPGPGPSDDDLLLLNRAATVAHLLAGATHDVNNALLVISGSAEVLEQRPPSPEALERGLTRIRSQSTRAAAVIAEVLSFARAHHRLKFARQAPISHA
jgi:signal transduction histidine kinase